MVKLICNNGNYHDGLARSFFPLESTFFESFFWCCQLFSVSDMNDQGLSEIRQTVSRLDAYIKFYLNLFFLLKSVMYFLHISAIEPCKVETQYFLTYLTWNNEILDFDCGDENERRRK